MDEINQLQHVLEAMQNDTSGSERHEGDARASAGIPGEQSLASFTQNINTVERWLLIMEGQLAQALPNPKTLRLTARDITTVLAELTPQLTESNDSAERDRCVGLLGRIQACLSRANVALKLSDKLEAEQQREAIETNSVDNIVDSPNYEPMTDLSRHEVDAKIAASEAKVDARLASFDTSIQTGFAELRTGFAEMRTEMAKQSGDLRTEMAKQSGDLRTEMANIRTEMHKGMMDIVRWVVGFGFAGLVATLSILTYINKSGSNASVTPTVTPIVAPAAPSSSEFRTNPPK